MFRLCNFVKHATKGAPHDRNTQVRKWSLGSSCWVRPSLNPTSSAPGHDSSPRSPFPLVFLSCFWAVGKTTKVRQLIPILHPCKLTSPKAATYPPFLHRRLLHNKQHLVLISTKTKTTRGREEGRDGGREGGVRGKAAEDNHREAGCEKTKHREKKRGVGGCCWSSSMRT